MMLDDTVAFQICSKNMGDHAPAIANSKQNNNVIEQPIVQLSEASDRDDSFALSSQDVYSRQMRPAFPVQLHKMLEEADKVAWLSGIVSWQPHGRSFIVHHPGRFVKEAAIRRYEHDLATRSRIMP